MLATPGTSVDLLATLVVEVIGAVGMSGRKARRDRQPIPPCLWYAVKTRSV